MKEILAFFVAVLSLTVVNFGFAETYSNGFESGVISEKEWQIDIDGECSIEAVTDLVREGKYSARFKSGDGARCEILPRVYKNFLTDQLREPFDEDRWYGFSTYLPEGWEFNDRNEVLAQWHSSRDVIFGEKGGRGPPLALRILRDKWRLTHGWDGDLLSKPGAKAIYPLWVDTIETGIWIDWVFHVRWSYKKEGEGIIEVWKNGEKIVSYKGPNTYNDIRGVYLKVGSYHPRQNRTLYFDNIWVDDENKTKLVNKVLLVDK